MFVIQKPWVVEKDSSRSPLSLVCCPRAYSPVTPSRLLPLQWSHSVTILCTYDNFRLCVCAHTYVMYVLGYVGGWYICVELEVWECVAGSVEECGWECGSVLLVVRECVARSVRMCC